MKATSSLLPRTQLRVLIAGSLLWFCLLALLPLVRWMLELPLPLQLVLLVLPGVFVFCGPLLLAFLGFHCLCTNERYFSSEPAATVLAVVLTLGTLVGFCWWVVPFVLRASS